MTMTEQPDLFSAVPDIVEPNTDGFARDGFTLDQRFEMFHVCNPWVAERLLAMTRALVERGRTRVGLKMLVETIRWEHHMTTNDPTSDFKLNNSLVSRYARLLMAEHPELDGVFETRELRS